MTKPKAGVNCPDSDRFVGKLPSVSRRRFARPACARSGPLRDRTGALIYRPLWPIFRRPRQTADSALRALLPAVWKAQSFNGFSPNHQRSITFSSAIGSLGLGSCLWEAGCGWRGRSCAPSAAFGRACMGNRRLGWPDVDDLRRPVELDVVARGRIPAFQAPTVSARPFAQNLHQHRSVLDLDDAKLADAIVGHAIEF